MPSQKNRTRWIVACFACGFALVSASCQKHTVQAAPPVSGPPVTTEPAAKPPAETTPAPLPETPPPVKPPPHRPSPPPKETPEPAPPKPAAPQISPQLSPEDLAEYQKKTNEDLAAAEKNLQRANGRQLNATQHDLVEKIRSFFGQSREAIEVSDWIRARNLAQKAHVLSVELVNSL
jgi:outer membrane biosynthesis protein TonB